MIKLPSEINVSAVRKTTAMLNNPQLNAGVSFEMMDVWTAAIESSKNLCHLILPLYTRWRPKWFGYGTTRRQSRRSSHLTTENIQFCAQVVKLWAFTKWCCQWEWTFIVSRPHVAIWWWYMSAFYLLPKCLWPDKDKQSSWRVRVVDSEICEQVWKIIISQFKLHTSRGSPCLYADLEKT